MTVVLEGRSALVTGGAGGLGAATVRHLVGVGLGVAIFDRDGEGIVGLSAELDDKTMAVSGDVNDDEAVAAAIDAARSLGTFSLLVNVAGGGLPPARTLRPTGRRTTRPPSSVRSR